MNYQQPQELNRIWRPRVELATSRASSQPPPSHSAGPMKTSLRHDRSSDPVYQLNCAIIDATQAHNTSARPYSRAGGQQASLVSPTLHQEPALFQGSPSMSSQQQQQQQLVHKQYNSPLDLYSMNNIRKTIEAHSELLAPGVKGINFMKAESPVNKQSEVYKLVKEQEEERKQRQHSSPAGHNQQQQQQQAPLVERQVPNVLISSSSCSSSTANNQQQRHVQYAAEHNYSSSSGGNNNNTNTAPVAIYQPAPSQQQQMVSSSSQHEHQTAPKCCECGQFIVGPFAKLQNKFVHPHCFNCSTCGSSLKNSGYFTISDKLYCEIHARQVANVMRLNYNFEPNKQTVDNTRQQYDEPVKSIKKSQQQVVTVQSQLKAEEVAQPQHQVHSTTTTTSGEEQYSKQHCANCCVTLKNQSATISSMFANRPAAPQLTSFKCSRDSCGGCSCNRTSEIRWTWRPACSTGSGGQAVTSSSSSNTQSRQFEQQQQQQQSIRQKYESRLVSSSSSSSSSSGRVPICCHCQIQIHGPYILAGQATWCKPCSQTHFVCNSCHRSLLNVGFIEDSKTANKYHCEHCFEAYLAPICAKCHVRIKDQDCLKALGKTWHPTCFVCGHCKCPFGNASFYLEDNVPYCERDWNLLFTTKCFSCSYPIEAGDKWIEALEHNYHSDCFRCTACQVKLEGSTFYCKADKPYCRMHAR